MSLYGSDDNITYCLRRDWEARGGIRVTMTLSELTRAIQQHIDLEMDSEVAQGMAEHALGFFGFYNRIIDNALEPTD